MQAQVDIKFEQLVRLAKGLAGQEWAKLKKEVEKEPKEHETSDLISFLLNAPTFSKKQFAEIAKTRKALNQWRKK